MVKKIHIKKFHFNASLVYTFFWFFTFAGTGIYILFSPFQLMRFWIPLVLFFCGFKNKKVSFGQWTKFFLFFYGVYFSYTFLVSILAVKTLVVTDCINFTMIYIILFVALFIGSDKSINIHELFINCINLFFFVTTLIAVYEITTRKHLPCSLVSDWLDFMKFTPSTFYANPNDYVCVLWLLHFIKICIKKDFLDVKYKLDDFLTFAVLITMSVICGARLAQLTVGLFLMAVFFQKKPLLCCFLLCSVIIVIFLSNYDELLKDKIVEEFSHHSSNEIRKNLYISAIRSVTRYDNYIGYGINQAGTYLRRNLNPDLYTSIIQAPHSHILEILLNSGLFFMLGFLSINFCQIVFFLKTKHFYYAAYTFCYFIILFCSASSLFLWPHYICACFIILAQDAITSGSAIETKRNRKRYLSYKYLITRNYVFKESI